MTQELDSLRLQSVAPKSSVSAKSLPTLQLRAQPKDTLSGEAVKAMLKQYDFYCAERDWSKDWSNPQGKGTNHRYELQQQGKVVIDRATGLMWQQSGSPKSMPYENAKAYVTQLNKEDFAGFNNWRLPTLEEAMSLMDPKELNGNLYIDPKFNKTQSWIWTANTYSARRAWSVNFGNGYCGPHDIGINDFGYVTYVRAVRS